MAYLRKEDLRSYNRRWMAARRQEFFNGKSCTSCGSKESLELDHIDRATKVHHAIWSWCKERRKAELAKCQVLCHNCHAKKTAAEIKIPFCERFAKVDEVIARQIKYSDERASEIVKRLGISKFVVSRIRTGQSWQHI